MKELKGIIQLDETGKSLLGKCKRKSGGTRKPDTGQYKTATTLQYEFEDGYEALITASMSRKDYYVNAALVKRAGDTVVDSMILFPREEIMGEYVFEKGDTKYVIEVTE